jgi:hypothetical protein
VAKLKLLAKLKLRVKTLPLAKLLSLLETTAVVSTSWIKFGKTIRSMAVVGKEKKTILCIWPFATFSEFPFLFSLHSYIKWSSPIKSITLGTLWLPSFVATGFIL